MTAKRKCSGAILGLQSNRTYKCSRNATVQYNGKWYCWQHDPERMKADKEKRRAADRAKMDRYTARWTRRTRDAKRAALVNEETAELLEWLARYEDVQANKARALAAQIREVLSEYQAA